MFNNFIYATTLACLICTYAIVQLPEPQTTQSVSWSGGGVYQAGNFPLLLSSLVKGESGILALSASSSSSLVGGNPSGTGKGLSLWGHEVTGLSLWGHEVTGFGGSVSFSFFFSIAVMPCKQSISILIPPTCLTSFSTSSFGHCCCNKPKKGTSEEM